MHFDLVWLSLTTLLGLATIRARVRGLPSHAFWSIFFWVSLSVLIVRWCFWEPFKTEGFSMSPTIPPKSLVVVNKTAYSTRFPFVLWRGSTVYPRPRDVVAFEHGKDVLVKRVWGRSGDWVLFDPKHGWFINGRWLAKPQAQDLMWLKHAGFPQQKHYDLGLLSQQMHRQWRTQRRWQLQIPQGYVFVLGDNRPQSIDSRSFGFVPVSHVLGEVRKVSDLSWGPLIHSPLLARHRPLLKEAQ